MVEIFYAACFYGTPDFCPLDNNGKTPTGRNLIDFQVGPSEPSDGAEGNVDVVYTGVVNLLINKYRQADKIDCQNISESEIEFLNNSLAADIEFEESLPYFAVRLPEHTGRRDSVLRSLERLKSDFPYLPIFKMDWALGEPRHSGFEYFIGGK